MKIKPSSEPKIITNSSAKKYTFTLSEDFVLDTFITKFYRYPIRTLVQEYISNGRDASLEKESKKNLKVQAPTVNDPVFRVRDYGGGMSPDQIQIFLAYGKSTKRNSNKLTGGFGYGGKSAFAYTDNFTIISYIDGIASHYLAYIGEDKKAFLEPRGDFTTTEENGTEIIIGVNPKDFFEFHFAICRATFFWDIKPDFIYLLDNPSFKKDLPFWNNYKPDYQINNCSFYLNPPDPHRLLFKPKAYSSYKRNQFDSGVIVLVDKIPYPLDSEYKSLPELEDLLKIIKDDRVITIDFSNDDLEIAPNRESLHKSKLTLEKLKETFTALKKEIIDHQIKKLKESDTFQQYAETQVFFNRLFTYPDFVTFKGVYDNYHVNQFDMLSADNLLNYGYTVASYGYYQDCDFKDSDVIDMKSCLLVFEDFNEGKNTLRGKMRQALKDLGINSSIVCFGFNNFKDKKFLKQMKEIGAAPSSTLPKEYKDLNLVKVKKKTNLSEVYITEVIVKKLPVCNQSALYTFDYHIEKDSKTINLNTLTNHFIYTQHKDGTMFYGSEFNPKQIQEKELRNLTLYLKENGHSFCSIAPSYVKRVNNSSFFTSLDQYLESQKSQDIQTNRVYRLMSLIEKSRYDALEPILNLIKPSDFDDPVIKDGFNLLCEVYKKRQSLKDHRSLPSIILNQETLRPEVQIEVNTVNSFFNKLNNSYPLYSAIRLLSEERSKTFVSDLILYFNSKFKELK
jgi:hypothetical protein